MDNLRQETIDTYNKSAKELAKYFQGYGARTKDIELGLKLAGKPKSARVVEIGCGDGRDAAEIIPRVQFYVGCDISSELIKIAQAKVPAGTFEIADVMNFEFPDNLDVVYAFASLLHLDKTEIKTVLQKVERALKTGGVFYVSLKYAPHYQEKIKKDKYGKRLFYFYSPEEIAELAGNAFRVVVTDLHTHGDTKWFTIALQKA